MESQSQAEIVAQLKAALIGLDLVGPARAAALLALAIDELEAAMPPDARELQLLDARLWPDTCAWAH